MRHIPTSPPPAETRANAKRKADNLADSDSEPQAPNPTKASVKKPLIHKIEEWQSQIDLSNTESYEKPTTPPFDMSEISSASGMPPPSQANTGSRSAFASFNAGVGRAFDTLCMQLERAKVFDHVVPTESVADDQIPAGCQPRNWQEILHVVKGYSERAASTLAPSGSPYAYVKATDHFSDPALYRTYWNLMSSASNEEDISGYIFDLFFGIDIAVITSTPHKSARKARWILMTISSEPMKDPEPDYMEGLRSRVVPDAVKDLLIDKTKGRGNYGQIYSDLYLPNFLVQHKCDGSMRMAHAQSRHDGAYAARCYYELNKLYASDEESLGYASVGTVEFNGSMVVLNVHWVEKIDGELQYNIKTIASFATAGWGHTQADFFNALMWARNFRQYFWNLRQAHVEKMSSLASGTRRRSYVGHRKSELQAMLLDHGLSKSGRKGELLQRLDQHFDKQDDDSEAQSESTRHSSDKRARADHASGSSRKVARR